MTRGHRTARGRFPMPSSTGTATAAYCPAATPGASENEKRSASPSAVRTAGRGRLPLDGPRVRRRRNREDLADLVGSARAALAASRDHDGIRHDPGRRARRGTRPRCDRHQVRPAVSCSRLPCPVATRPAVREKRDPRARRLRDTRAKCRRHAGDRWSRSPISCGLGAAISDEVERGWPGVRADDRERSAAGQRVEDRLPRRRVPVCERGASSTTACATVRNIAS